MVEGFVLGVFLGLGAIAWVGGGGLAAATMAEATMMVAAENDGGDGGETCIFHHRRQCDKKTFPPSFPLLAFVVYCLQGEGGGMGWLAAAATMAAQRRWR